MKLIVWAFLVIIAIAGMEYAADRSCVVWWAGGVIFTIVSVIAVALYQSWMDARETDKLLGGGL